MSGLVVTDQRVIDFYGTELVAIQDTTGQIWVPLRRLSEAIGVASNNQIEKVRQDPVMGEDLVTVPVTLPDGRTYQMECLPLKYVRAWLFGINANRVKPEVRDRLMQYQREVIEIIDRAFSPTAPAPDFDDAVLDAMRENALQQARLWEAVIAERRRLRATEQAVQAHDDQLEDHERRLSSQERALSQALQDLARLRGEQSAIFTRFSDLTRLLPAPSDPIDAAQKAAIKALVDDIVATAQALGVRLGQGRNDYPAVWDAFKRRFDLAKYDELPRERLEEALGWLKAWRERLDEG